MHGEQLKFFGDGNDSNSKPKRRLIVIPLDTFILSSVVIFLLFILAFSLGVEKGRKISFASDDAVTFPESSLRQETQALPLDKKNSAKAEQKIVVSPVVKGNEIQTVQSQAGAKVNIPAVDNNVKEGYYIQLASYNKESFANDEAKKLKSKGFPAYIAKKGNFIVLYVGIFKTSAEAQKNMGILKKNYKDCVLRRL
jgi:septal ring-binding cell division protein DamX